MCIVVIMDHIDSNNSNKIPKNIDNTSDNSIDSIDGNNDVDVMLIYLKNILHLLTISLDYINTTTINNNIMTYDISNTTTSNTTSNTTPSGNSTISIKVI